MQMTIGTVLSKQHNPMGKIEFKQYRDADGSAFSFFYIHVLEGTQRVAGSAQFQKQMQGFSAMPHGTLISFDASKNMVKQVDLFKEFAGDMTLPPVIDIHTHNDIPLTSEDFMETVHQFYDQIRGLCDRRKLRHDPVIRITEEQAAGLIDTPEWFSKAGWWIYAEAGSEWAYVPTVMYGLDTCIHVDPDWISSFLSEQSGEASVRPAEAISPYYVIVTNLEGAPLFEKPTIDSTRCGRIKYRNILRITAESGAFAFAGMKVNRWLLLKDIEPYKPKS